MGIIEVLHNSLPSSVLFKLGPISLHWYGLLLAVGIWAGYAVTRRLWREQGRDLAELERLVVVAIIVGLVGARLVDAFVYEWWYFGSHLSELPQIWHGGLAWHGALLGLGLVLWWWQRHSPGHMLPWLDAFAPGLALGQAVGRWGNYFNQELFGLPTGLPWGIPIAVANRPAAYLAATHFHPVFLYESLILLAIAWVLWRLRRRLKVGSLFALYLCLSGGARLALEMWRVDEQDTLGGVVRTGSLVAIVAIAVGSVLWWRSWGLPSVPKPLDR